MTRCYICGVELIKNINKSKDHVPPECIYPDNKPKNLTTVPCCIKCNDEFKLLDEKMRNYMAIVAGKNSETAGEIAMKEVLRSNKLYSEFMAKTKRIQQDDKTRLLFYFDEKELEKWLARLVKGLYFNKNRKRLPESTTFTVKPLPQYLPQPSNTFPMEEGLEYRPYFVYGIVHDELIDYLKHWIFIFYDYLIFMVSVKYNDSK